MSLTWERDQMAMRAREETRKFCVGLLFAALFNLPLIALALWEWHRGILR